MQNIQSYHSSKNDSEISPFPLFHFSIFRLNSLSQWTLKKKSLNFIFPTKYVIPKSLKFGHWLSESIFPPPSVSAPGSKQLRLSRLQVLLGKAKCHLSACRWLVNLPPVNLAPTEIRPY